VLLVKLIETENPFNGQKSVKIKTMLKLFGGGRKSSLEDGFDEACSKSCISPLCKYYSVKIGCISMDKLVKEWTKNKK
jgi:hypothetical protein